MFPEAELRETLRFEENKINCFPRDQSSCSSQSIKIGISDFIDSDCIGQSVGIDDTLVSFIDLS